MVESILIPIAVIVFLALIASVKIINQYEKGVVLRLGKYRSTSGSGVTIVFLLLRA